MDGPPFFFGTTLCNTSGPTLSPPKTPPWALFFPPKRAITPTGTHARPRPHSGTLTLDKNGTILLEEPLPLEPLLLPRMQLTYALLRHGPAPPQRQQSDAHWPTSSCALRHWPRPPPLRPASAIRRPTLHSLRPLLSHPRHSSGQR
jgi:hypothetical protein